MNRILTLLFVTICLTAVGQVQIEYPFNPDGNSDGYVGAPDLIELLTIYSSPFQPNNIMVDSVSFDDWVDAVNAALLTQQNLIDSLFQNCLGTSDVDPSDADGCAGETTVNYNGYDYEVISIGGKCWFAENLRTESYTNGDPISQVEQDWLDGVLGCTGSVGSNPIGSDSCFYASVGLFTYFCDTTATNPPGVSCDSLLSLEFYGRLYNWQAVIDERGICPVGWHVSSDADWLTLETSLGMEDQEALVFSSSNYRGDVAIQLKSMSGWGLVVDGLNTSGFNAVAGGFRDRGYFVQCGYLDDQDHGTTGYWWTNSYYNEEEAVYRKMNLSSGVLRYRKPKHMGMSVRCVKDTE